MKKQLIGAVLAAVIAAPITTWAAEKLLTKTVEEIHTQKATLSGKHIRLSGKVVKVNNDIMGKNFLHIQDGTGGKGTNDITVTSQQTAKVGDMLEIDALVVTNRDFGMGYSYAVILEKAKLSPAH